MASEQSIRKVGETGGNTKFITLPDKWVKEKQIEKGDNVIVIYNGTLKVILTTFDVVLKQNVVWFNWREQKAGMKLEEVKRLVSLYGLKKAIEIINKGLKEKQGFPNFPEELMEEKLNHIVFEFLQ